MAILLMTVLAIFIAYALSGEDTRDDVKKLAKDIRDDAASLKGRLSSGKTEKVKDTRMERVDSVADEAIENAD